MQVILLERVGDLGGIGDEVKVRPGFARNYLLPQGKALRANEANRRRFEAERAVLEQRNAERRAAAQTEAEKLDGQQFVMIRQAGESGQLYGSVTARDVADAATEAGFPVQRSQISLDTPIKTLGLHDVRVRLHAEVAVTVQVNVARTEEEAERQASGEDVIAAQAEADRAFDDALAAELEANTFDEDEGVMVRDRGDDEADAGDDEAEPA